MAVIERPHLSTPNPFSPLRPSQRGEKGSISGTLGYTDGFDEDILPEQDVQFYGGVSLSYTF